MRCADTRHVEKCDAVWTSTLGKIKNGNNFPEQKCDCVGYSRCPYVASTKKSPMLKLFVKTESLRKHRRSGDESREWPEGPAQWIVFITGRFIGQFMFF